MVPVVSLLQRFHCIYVYVIFFACMHLVIEYFRKFVHLFCMSHIVAGVVALHVCSNMSCV